MLKAIEWIWATMPWMRRKKVLCPCGCGLKLYPVLLCTEYKGVFFGYAGWTHGDRMLLHSGRMAIQFGTTAGLVQLAERGPGPNSHIGSRGQLDVRAVTLVCDVTPAGVAAWEAAPTKME